MTTDPTPHLTRLVDDAEANRARAVKMRVPGHTVFRIPLSNPHHVGGGYASRAFAVEVDGTLRGCIAIMRTVQRLRGGPSRPGWRVYTFRAPLRHYGTKTHHCLSESRGGLKTEGDAVAALLDELVKYGRAPTVAEVGADLLAADAENEAKSLARAQQQADRARQREEAAAREAEEAAHIAEALQSIRDRLGADLTNYESAGLALAIARFPITNPEG